VYRRAACPALYDCAVDRGAVRLDWDCRPLDVVAAWPADRALAVLHSGRLDGRFARWSIVACPEAFERPADGPGGAFAEALAPEAPGPPAADGEVPFAGGWIGWLSYDLGRVLEPAADSAVRGPRARDDRSWPLAEFAWCPGALVYDGLHRAWFAAGAEPPVALGAGGPRIASFRCGPLRSAVTRDEHLSAVRRAIEYIAAGDIFQANITQRLSCDFEGSTRALAVEALAQSGAWYGAYLELPGGRALVSLSPELFVDVDAATGTVMTRPVKGTRPATAPRGELLRSAKDEAELNMIVDLSRNDLGRVCEVGSIRVPEARRIETHPTVHHGVAEVTGRLRTQTTLDGLLRAAFPAGSVTGAPKIRAMQVIDELEPVRRGPYCGSIGFLSPGRRCTFNVAIRTIALSGARPSGRWDVLEGTLDYGAGGGIVADSDPEAEHRESLDKAEILRRVLPSTSRPAPQAAWT
jgi:anthranilate/para-aminobenzoate synthase component I